MMPSAAVRPRRAVDMPLVAVSNVLPCFANWPVARLARLIPDVNSAESRPSTTRSAPTTLEAMCGYSNKKRRPESRPVRQWLFVRSAFQLHLRGERWLAVGIVRIEFCRRCFCGDSWLIFEGFLSAPKLRGNGTSSQRQRAESPYRLPARWPHFGCIRSLRKGRRSRGLPSLVYLTQLIHTYTHIN